MKPILKKTKSITSVKKQIINFWFKNQNLKIIVKQSNRKSLSLKINSQNQIIFNKPFYASWDYCQKFLENNLDKMCQLLEKRKKNFPYSLNEKWCRLWGKKYSIISQEQDKDFYIDNNFIYLNNKNIKKSWLSFIKNMENIVKKLAEYILKKENIQAIIIMKNLKTTWGICHHKKRTISLSKKLIHFSQNIIEYVIYHEITHLFHQNHGPEFKIFLKSKVPNYLELKKKLISW